MNRRNAFKYTTMLSLALTGWRDYRGPGAGREEVPDCDRRKSGHRPLRWRPEVHRNSRRKERRQAEGHDVRRRHAGQGHRGGLVDAGRHPRHGDHECQSADWPDSGLRGAGLPVRLPDRAGRLHGAGWPVRDQAREQTPRQGLGAPRVVGGRLSQLPHGAQGDHQDGRHRRPEDSRDRDSTADRLPELRWAPTRYRSRSSSSTPRSSRGPSTAATRS